MNKRVKLRKPNMLKLRSKHYALLRRHWLAELCWLRAKRRNGTATRAEIKAAQRALAKVRQGE